MKRVLFAHRKLSYGGGERVLIEQMAALAELPVQVDLLFRKEPARRDIEPELRERLPNLGRVEHVPGILGAARWLWRERPDVLVLCNHKGVQRALPWLARLGLRIPTVVTLHEHYERHLRKYEGISPYVDRWIITWAFEAAVRAQLGGQPCVQIHPLYPRPGAVLLDEAARSAARRHLGLPEAGPVVGYVGALDERKDPTAIASLAMALARQLPGGLDLLFAGRESEGASRELDRLAPRLAEAGLRMHRLGAQKDLDPAFSSLDLYLMASRNEGFFPIALIEALERGVPVAAPSVGGIGTVLRDGQGGFLVPKADDRGPVSPEALEATALRIAPLMKDPLTWGEQRRLAHDLGTGLTRGYDAAARFREALSPWL